jgi:hypothetical protein
MLGYKTGADEGMRCTRINKTVAGRELTRNILSTTSYATSVVSTFT